MTQAERTWNWLWDILYAPTRHHLVYVYRLSLDGNPVGSFVWKGSPRPELPEILRDGLRGGDFRVLIRQKRQMVFGGNISIETPREATRARCPAAGEPLGPPTYCLRNA